MEYPNNSMHKCKFFITKTFKFDRQVINFKTSISGRYLVTCDSMGKMSLYDLIKGEMMSSFNVP